ncbi:MAG: GNAT family N-acetyltransferase [Anaerolineae bacterium]
MATDRNIRRALILDQRFEPLAALMRGSSMESVHRGAVAVVDSSGLLRSRVGDATVSILLRSAAKPFQALAVVESGAAEAFAVSPEELAVMAGSHAGQREHSRLVAGLLERCALGPDALLCGSLVHMCSGKHAGMLLLARHLGAPVDGYEQPDHPVQWEIALTIARLLRMRPGSEEASEERLPDASVLEIFDGADGCGVPAIRLPLEAAAWLYALLGAGATPGLAAIRDAMVTFPTLMGGGSRFDTRLMAAASGQLVAKGGAEGVQGLAISAMHQGTGPTRPAMGIVIKVADGSARPVPALTRRCLEACGLELPSEMPTQTAPRDEWTERALTPGEWAVLIDPWALGCFGPEEVGPGRAEFDPGDDKDRLTLLEGRGDEKEVDRFLREEWPLSDEETFGRETQWIADPFALILIQRRRVVAVLKGHFLGGLASVDEFIVGRDFRGRGIGAHLLERFEKEARLRGCTRIVLRTVKGGRAESFYRRLGYERECVQLDYEFGEDFVRLARRLRTDGDGV